MWCRYERMNIIRFLSSVGRNLRMGRMLGRTSVKSRIESDVGLSLTEFTYQAFQVKMRFISGQLRH